MPTKRRAALLCLLLLPFALLMATKIRSQSRTAAAKQAKPAQRIKSAGVFARAFFRQTGNGGCDAAAA